VALAPGGGEIMLDHRVVWLVVALVVAAVIGAAFAFGA